MVFDWMQHQVSQVLKSPLIMILYLSKYPLEVLLLKLLEEKC